ncbi:MAG: hypothetical protein M5U01_04050 [Ardenticatenaceae bacterium]|nr:hypothetical protein [Ardenticatenaceae bacterium]
MAAGSGDPAGAGVRDRQAGVGVWRWPPDLAIRREQVFAIARPGSGVWRWPPDLAIQREQVFAHGSAEGVLDSFPAFLNAL